MSEQFLSHDGGHYSPQIMRQISIRDGDMAQFIEYLPSI